MMKTATVASETPIHKSLSVLEAKARIQNPEINMSLVIIATRRININWYPSKLGSVNLDGAILLVSMVTLVPIAIEQMMRSSPIMAPWMLSVMNEIRKPPSAAR